MITIQQRPDGAWSVMEGKIELVAFFILRAVGRHPRPETRHEAMTTLEHRERITREYDVDSHGRIRALGKYEGQMLYVPFFWDLALDRCADRDDGQVYKFRLDSHDLEVWPELRGRRWISLTSDENGFVTEMLINFQDKSGEKEL